MAQENVVLSPEKQKKAGIAAAVVVVAVLLFGSGWAFGRGGISLNNLKSGKISSAGGPLDYSSVNEVYSQLQANFDGSLDKTKLLDGLKTGLANATGDTHTEYFNPKASQDFQDQLNGNFEGIGAELGKEGTNIVIISPLAGSPAEKAGIKPKDIIVKINDKAIDDISIDEAVTQIRGKAGTTVKLQLVRAGALVDVTITRAEITVPSVIWKEDGTIGILTVSRFGEDTPALVDKAAAEFTDKKVTGIILDVRNDPGGVLESAVKLSSEWLSQGTTVLTQKGAHSEPQVYKASGTPYFKGIKTVMLINGGSASASEITAGALHDNKAANLMGEKSYGKGSVQQVLNLDGGGTLKVTIARWYTPNDKNIDKQGIEPDTALKQSDDDTKNGVDTVMQAALASLR